MPLDLPSSLSGGKTALAGLIYIGSCLYVAGPLVGERTIARSNWDVQCETLLKAESAAPETPRALMPRLDCRSLLGWLGNQGREVCDTYGNPTLDLQGLGEFGAAQRHLQEIHQEQFHQKLALNPSRCTCAVTATLERQRISFGLYAGTARLVTPPAIRNLSSELHSSLRSPLCTFASKGGRAS